MSFRPTRKKADRRKAPASVKGILSSVLKQHGLEHKIDRYRFVTHWKEIVGEELARRTRPECIQNGALVVRVPSSAWAQELVFHKAVILSRLKDFLDGDERVRDIRFQVA